MNDPISDMLTRIRNAIAVRKPVIELPHSKAKESVARILKNNGFIEDVSVSGDKPMQKLSIRIFNSDSNPRITEITRKSKPGRRLYVGAAALPVVKRGRGLAIISTSQGLLTNDEARQKGVGGEVICEVY